MTVSSIIETGVSDGPLTPEMVVVFYNRFPHGMIICEGISSRFVVEKFVCRASFRIDVLFKFIRHHRVTSLVATDLETCALGTTSSWVDLQLPVGARSIM